MSTEIRFEDHRSLAEYAAIAAAFDVREALGAVTAGPAPSPLPHRAIHPPFRKDYDAIEGNGPDGWHARFALDRARFIAAYVRGRRVGGAVVIVDSANVARLGGQPSRGLLWDIRVAPEARGRGIGRALLGSAEAVARETGCRGMIAETQDNNVAACRLYAHAGYDIRSVDAAAYPCLAGETQIVWEKTFTFPVASG